MVGRFANADAAPIDGVPYWQPMLLPDEVRLRAAADPEVGKRLLEAAQNYATQFGNPYMAADDTPYAPATEDPLKEWAIATRTSILRSTHAAYTRNPLANTIVQYTADFAVRGGFTLTCLNSEVEAILQEFIDDPDNAIREVERQLVIDLQVDGEVILRFFTEDGRTVVVPLRPWEIKSIKTEAGLFRRPVSFKLEYTQTEGDSPDGDTEDISEDVPAEEILFTAINRHSYELRGRPDLYRLLPWLRADVEFLSDRARQAKFRGSLLWWVKVTGATQALMSAVVGRWRTPPPTGSVYVSTEREEVTPLANPTNAGDASEDGRAVRMMAILGARMPEYFFGNGENSNLASASRQQLPALTKFDAFQDIMTHQIVTPMLRRVLENAIAAGLIREQVPIEDPDGNPTGELIDTLNAFEATYDPVSEQSLGELANMLATATNSFDISIQTAQERLGFDPQQERDRKAREDAAMMDRMAAGLIPTPPPFQKPAADETADEDAEEDVVEEPDEPEAD